MLNRRQLIEDHLENAHESRVASCRALRSDMLLYIEIARSILDPRSIGPYLKALEGWSPEKTDRMHDLMEIILSNVGIRRDELFRILTS